MRSMNWQGAEKVRMARRQAAPTETPELPTARLREAETPWAAPAKAAFLSAFHAGRLPHALLLHGSRGAGQSGLALWAAQAALCDIPLDAPCGRCPSCELFLAGNHPDLRAVTVEDKATVIKVEQVRELCGALALTSYRGGRKVGVLDPADKMNINAFNALLKTLEEPSQETLLVLAVTQLDRLPRTVVSRCQRIRVPNPATPAALEWLTSEQPGEDWQLLLDLAGGAPLAALELARTGATRLADEMKSALTGRRFDPLVLAQEWSRDRPADRLRWLEHWLESSLRSGLGRGSDVVNNNRHTPLPSSGAGVNITAAFRLLDQTRETRRLLEGSLNTQLLFEDLLVGLAEAIAGRSAG